MLCFLGKVRYEGSEVARKFKRNRQGMQIVWFNEFRDVCHRLLFGCLGGAIETVIQEDNLALEELALLIDFQLRIA